MSSRRNWAEDDSSDDDDDDEPQTIQKVEEKKPNETPPPPVAVSNQSLNNNYNNRGNNGNSNSGGSSGGSNNNYYMDRDNNRERGPPMSSNYNPNYQGSSQNYNPNYPHNQGGRGPRGYPHYQNYPPRGSPMNQPPPYGNQNYPPRGSPMGQPPPYGNQNYPPRGSPMGQPPPYGNQNYPPRGSPMGQQNGGYSRGDVRGDARGETRSDVRGKQDILGSEDEIMLRDIEMARKERELLQNKKVEEQKGNDSPSSQQEAPFLNTNPSPNQNMRPNNGNPPRHFINNNSPRSDSEERWSRAKITPQPAVKAPTSPSIKNSDNTTDSNSDAIKALIGPDRSLPKSSSNSPVKKDEAWKRSSSNDSESNPQPNRQKSNSINNSESNHSTPDVVKIMARPNNVSNNDSSTIVDNSKNKNNSDNDNAIVPTKKTPQGHYIQKQDTNDRGASNEHDQKYEQARALRMKESMERCPRTKGVLYRYNEKGEIERVFDRDDGGEVNVPFNQANTTKTILKKAPANV